MLSRHSQGVAVVPVFGRPRPPEERIDVFVLMPFNTKMEKVYTNHIKKMGEELGVTIRRADEIFLPGPFMKKVWDGISAAHLILADCTEKNLNVFYEIGIAHTVGKKSCSSRGQMKTSRPTSSISTISLTSTIPKASRP